MYHWVFRDPSFEETYCDPIYTNSTNAHYQADANHPESHDSEHLGEKKLQSSQWAG